MTDEPETTDRTSRRAFLAGAAAGCVASVAGCTALGGYTTEEIVEPYEDGFKTMAAVEPDINEAIDRIRQYPDESHDTLTDAVDSVETARKQYETARERAADSGEDAAADAAADARDNALYIRVLVAEAATAAAAFARGDDREAYEVIGEAAAVAQDAVDGEVPMEIPSVEEFRDLIVS